MMVEKVLFYLYLLYGLYACSSYIYLLGEAGLKGLRLTKLPTPQRRKALACLLFLGIATDILFKQSGYFLIPMSFIYVIITKFLPFYLNVEGKSLKQAAIDYEKTIKFFLTASYTPLFFIALNDLIEFISTQMELPPDMYFSWHIGGILLFWHFFRRWLK